MSWLTNAVLPETAPRARNPMMTTTSERATVEQRWPTP